jgi:sugar/nucleoside kinase (ribokinase family)
MKNTTTTRHHGYIYLFVLVVAVMVVDHVAAGSSFLGSYVGSLVVGATLFEAVYLVDRTVSSRRR